MRLVLAKENSNSVYVVRCVRLLASICLRQNTLVILLIAVVTLVVSA